MNGAVSGCFFGRRAKNFCAAAEFGRSVSGGLILPVARKIFVCCPKKHPETAPFIHRQTSPGWQRPFNMRKVGWNENGKLPVFAIQELVGKVLENELRNSPFPV
jgi:hypothetical protein